MRTSRANPPVLGMPKRGCPYIFDTVARRYALGAILLQKLEVTADHRKYWKKKGTNADTPEKEWVAIGYWYKTFIAAEKNYSTTERECMSVVEALKTLHSMSKGRSSYSNSTMILFVG